MSTRNRNITITVVIAIIAAIAVWWWLYAIRHNQQITVLSQSGDIKVNGQVIAKDTTSFDAHNAKIEVPAGSTFNGQLSDGSYIQIIENTRLDIPQAQRSLDGSRVQTEFKLDSGEIIRNIPKLKGVSNYSSRLATQSVNVGIRGTRYAAIADSSSTRAMLYHGEVALMTDGNPESRLRENFGTITEKGKAPQSPALLPSPPGLSSPATGNRIESASLVLSWKPVNEAQSYMVELATDLDFNNVVYREASNFPELRIAQLPFDAHFQWRVSSIDRRELRGDGSAPRSIHYKYHHDQLLNLSDNSAMETLIEKAMRGYSTDPVLLRDIARLYVKNNNHDQALNYYNLAIENGTANSELLIERGNVYRSLDKHNEAESDFNLALTKEEQNPEAFWGLGKVEYKEGNLEESIEYFYRAIAVEPKHSSAHLNAARAWLKLNQVNKAEHHIKLHLENYPDDTEAISLLDKLPD